MINDRQLECTTQHQTKLKFQIRNWNVYDIKKSNNYVINYDSEYESFNNINDAKQHKTVNVYKCYETLALAIRFKNNKTFESNNLSYLQSLFHNDNHWSWQSTNFLVLNPIFIIQTINKNDYNELIYDLESGYIHKRLEDGDEFIYEPIYNWNQFNAKLNCKK